MNHPEYNLQKQVCQYLNIAHRNVLYMSDTVASLKLTMGQKVRNKTIQKDEFKTPDLIILEPNEKYCGLFIELKVETPYKKDGQLKKCEHLEGQQKSINDLKSKGYYATFSWGFDMTKNIIDDYIKNKL